MRLKEAVSTLRLVKTELESSRKTYAELEAKHREVLKKLQLGGTNENGAVDKKDDDSGDIHDGEATPSEDCAATLRKELLEAHEAAARWEEMRRAMEDEARSMRDELAALKESMANQSQKLKEALDGKEEAIQAVEQARVRAMAAEDVAAKQEARAVTAEEQLEGASNLAEIFRIRLEEMNTEKESACTLLSHVSVGVKEEIGGEGGKSKADEEDAAELERELNLIREALGGQASGTKDSLSCGAVEEACQRAERLQAELDSATNENSKLRESLENARKESEAAGERAAVALEESKALKIAVAAAVAAREQVERIAAEERTKQEKKLSSLRERQKTLLAELAKVDAEMREAKKEASEAVDASSSRIAVLQARVEEAEATRDAALDARNSEVKVDPEILSAGEVELEGDTISVGTWRDAATTGKEEKRRVMILQHGSCGFDICIRPCGCCQNTALQTVQDAESQQEREAAMVVNNGDGDHTQDQEEEEILEPQPPPRKTRRKRVENKEEEEVEPSKKRKREDTNKKKPVAKKGKKGDKFKVFVGRLSRQIKDDELREFFKPCGKIKSLELLKKPKGRTTATVRFGTAAAALKAVGMNGRELGGRTLAISKWRAELYTTVYVGNLSWSINEEAIRDTFGKCGEIKSICFAEDRNTGRFSGYCHVEFIDESSVEAALELMGTVVMGRPLCVDFSGVRRGRGKGKDEDMDRRGSEACSPLPKQGIKPFKGTRTTFD